MLQIGPDVTIYCGDARDIIPTLAEDLYVLTDPPFGKALMSTGSRADRGVRPAFRGRRLIQGDGDTEVGQRVLDLCRGRGWPILAFADPLQPWPGGDWRQMLAWDKGEAVGIGGDRATCWKYSWELIQVGRFPRVFGSRDSSVLRYPITPDNYDHHPAAKPVQLLRYLIKKLVPRGSIVLDPFMGSGRMGVAAIQAGCKFVGIEIDEAYFEVARKLLTTANGDGLLRQTLLWS